RSRCSQFCAGTRSARRGRHRRSRSRKVSPVLPVCWRDRSMSVIAATVTRMSNAAPWAATAGNKFREVARTTDNPTTKLLAEGLTALTEAIRELDAKLNKVDQQVRSSAA